ncbi:MAG TPA: hypothetical protein VNH64_04845 [Parvularculaceae bacterium]|nr:hypothetical protein [Parvularculaceae bacterium]
MTLPERPDRPRFLTEVLGIDGSGFRLMFDVFIRPRKVFAAFMTDDQDRYAPPIRVWLWIFGLKTLALLAVGGVGGALSRAVAAMPSENFAFLLQPFHIDTDRLVNLMNNSWDIFEPILVLLLSIPAAFTLALFARGKRFTHHANIYLSCLVAASLISVIAVLAVILDRPQAARYLSPLTVAIFALTFLRGGGGVRYFTTPIGAVLKTAILSGVLVLTNTLAGAILMIGLVMWAKHFPA